MPATHLSAGVVECVVTEKSTKYKIVEDPERLEKLRAGLKPFQLVKYFSFSSLGVILLFTLVLSWAISKHARQVMLAQSEAYSLLLAQNLNQQVVKGFVLPTFVSYGKIALSNPDQFQRLDSIVRSATSTMKMESVTIYDSNVNIISYSTDSTKVGKKDQGGIEYERALQGEANSQVYSGGSIVSFVPGTPAVHYSLKTFIPFRLIQENSPGEAPVMGVIEIIQDLSEEYGAIIQLQRSVILVSSTLMGILFLVLRTIVSRADKIMEKRVRERLGLEQKLHNVERLAHLGTMVATVSHEIKSPLGIIRSTAEILAKRIKKVAPGNEALAEIIVAETTRLNNIVMEFLDFARPQKVRLKPVDINRSIGQVLQFIEADLHAKKIVLHQELDESIGEITIDADLFYRAVLNILVNGIQAMPSGGILTVKTAIVKRTGSIAISIEDTGEGMSEDTLAEIFTPFFTNKSKGTGLGLSITKNIIDQHHGIISVTSQKAKGTVFTITLP